MTTIKEILKRIYSIALLLFVFTPIIVMIGAVSIAIYSVIILLGGGDVRGIYNKVTKKLNQFL